MLVKEPAKEEGLKMPVLCIWMHGSEWLFMALNLSISAHTMGRN